MSTTIRYNVHAVTTCTTSPIAINTQRISCVRTIYEQRVLSLLRASSVSDKKRALMKVSEAKSVLMALEANKLALLCEAV